MDTELEGKDANMAATTEQNNSIKITNKEQSGHSQAEADSSAGKAANGVDEKQTDHHQETRGDSSHEQPFERRRPLVRRTSTNSWSVSDSIVDFRESGGSYSSERNHGDWEHAHPGRRKKDTAG